MWELDNKKGWVLKNLCFWKVVLEKTLESPLDSKAIDPVNPKGNQLNIHWKSWCWSWRSNTLATWCKEPTHWNIPRYWERLKTGGEVDDRAWDGWMVSLIQRTWVWTNSRKWWRTGKPVLLQSMGLQSQTWLSDWTTTAYPVLELLLLFNSTQRKERHCFLNPHKNHLTEAKIL